MGDFNHMPDNRLKSNYYLKQIVKKPTRLNAKLDLIYTNMASYYQEPKVDAALGLSDHQVVVCSPKPSYTISQPRKWTQEVRIFSQNSKAMFANELENINWAPLYRVQSCQEKYDIFENIMHSLIQKHFPTKLVTRVETEKPWVTDNFRDAVRERQIAYLNDKSLYRVLRNKVNRMRKSLRKRHCKSHVDSLDNHQSRNWWKEVKSLTGQQSNYDPLYNLAEKIAEGDKSVLAEKINTFFASVSADLPRLNPPENHDDRNLDFLNLISDHFIIQVHQVEKQLRSVDTKKSPGPDQIPSWILKDFSHILSGPICSIFNASIAQAYVPPIWKSANVVTIPKVNPPAQENDLRPISLTPVLAKLLENFIYKWLWNEYLPHIDKSQFGSIPGSSTVLALIDLCHNWYFLTDSKKQALQVLLVDFSKAFDRINHVIIIDKLVSLGINRVIVNWIHAFLCDRKQRVKLGDTTSEWSFINGGVPQGTKLGPLLFIIMLTDLQPVLPVVKYVDDTTVYDVLKLGQNGLLQESLNELIKWTSDNCMTINQKKTKQLVINFTKNEYDVNLIMNNESIEQVHEAKLLGVWINDKLNWDTHVNDIYSKAVKRLYLLVQLRRAGLCKKDLCKYYTTCIRSVLEYACQVFHGGLTKEQSDLLESVQKRALRIIDPDLNYNDAINVFGLQTLKDRRANMCHCLFTQMQNTSHKLHNLLPEKRENTSRYELRNSKPFPLPRCKTNRFKNSFVPWCLYNLQ